VTSDSKSARKVIVSKLFSHQNILLLVLIALVVGFGIIEPVFFKPRVLFDVLSIIGEIGLMAMAMTFVISTGGIDLGVGYNLQMSAIVFGLTYVGTGSLALGIVLALLTGLAGGVFNGLVISRTRIPPLVTTLATMYLYRSFQRSSYSAFCQSSPSTLSWFFSSWTTSTSGVPWDET